MTKIVELDKERKRREKLKPIAVNRRLSTRCEHDHHTAIVDPGQRRVECDGCGAELDPYETLLLFCRQGNRYERLARECDRLSKKLKELRAEERRTKARVKRWRKKSDEAGFEPAHLQRAIDHYLQRKRLGSSYRTLLEAVKRKAEEIEREESDAG